MRSSSNLEIKIKIENPLEKEALLLQIGAQKIYSSIQTDTYYQVKEGRLKIRDSDGEKSIIYYSRSENTDERWSDFNLINIENPQLFSEFFDRFLERLVVVKKNRTLYHYKNTRIHLDSLDNFGHFIELETNLAGNINQAREEFGFLIDYLKLHIKDQYLYSYSDMILNEVR